MKQKVYSHCMTILEELIRTNAPYVANVDLLMREFLQLGYIYFMIRDFVLFNLSRDLEAAEEFIINLMDSNVSFNLINVSNLIKVICLFFLLILFSSSFWNCRHMSTKEMRAMLFIYRFILSIVTDPILYQNSKTITYFKFIIVPLN